PERGGKHAVTEHGVTTLVADLGRLLLNGGQLLIGERRLVGDDLRSLQRSPRVVRPNTLQVGLAVSRARSGVCRSGLPRRRASILSKSCDFRRRYGSH